MNGDDKIQITFTLNEWNSIIAMLAKQPYEQAAPFIQGIAAQAQQAAQAALAAALPVPPAVTSLNGATELKPVPPASASSTSE